ncbi:beta-ribofuranosylaminobenzene 5'-phosphate synthase family protein [Halocalculus aciditolerans]|uniref:Beta-ribofuranosylaminobenzene 5'-phosphate synthase n=1 Tax=Halocalculus aciditolerans TaxID=1383812 RepID=A0A830FFT9_9EURY|nr:beta-ribofuranosylaminobenzene 5'-phosphate synthase family protein [Halocalculus aciditolerans]GGL51063.1 beta-ribofuranosylaminobenzene 5'-phosphate synthase [Halocalculus aciditolerans]
MSVRVVAHGRLHFGFVNLSLAHERLYGSLGVAVDGPRTVVTAEQAGDLDCPNATARAHARRTLDILGLPGARVRVEESLPRHVGLGSGTQLALAVLAAVAEAYDRDPRVRERAPAFGRGGRSGVGVAAFEDGGFVLDAGHPAAEFTPDRPADGEWTVPPVSVRRDIRDSWRFLLVVPDAPPGRHGDDEDTCMRDTIDAADPGLADEIAGAITRRVLPALATADHDAFGAAVDDIGRRNGEWYADVQGGTYCPPAGDLVEHLRTSPAIAGAGQTSWGPAVYGITSEKHADAARDAGERALDEIGLDGDVFVVEGRNEGGRVDGCGERA